LSSQVLAWCATCLHVHTHARTLTPCSMPARKPPRVLDGSLERPDARHSDPPSQATAGAAIARRRLRTRRSFVGRCAHRPHGGPHVFAGRSRCTRRQRTILGCASMRSPTRVRHCRSLLPAPRTARSSAAQRGGHAPAGGLVHARGRHVGIIVWVYYVSI
jgi:hypothetical protein